MVGRAARLLLGAAAGIVGLGLVLLAGWLVLHSFHADYSEARFDARLFAAVAVYYGAIYLVHAVVFLRRGRPPRWVVLLAALGFLTPALYSIADWLYLGMGTDPRWLPLGILAEHVWEFYRPPFTVLHGVLYGCAALALVALWLRWRSAQLQA
ncbi:hypothetical protein NET02_16145 [Thermomicrobiaceae bacterium CFH 74404]|uniref:Uncharacterized protein n=1 Tax=Thermalbibacter longus TaxID=2951981 RepID=A0AA42BC85_9BACT|nr:hypothetical protein [Thermalbibacter longus]MCM8750675.1 hypothetical protein [Thermalbibacter longus]